MLVTLDDAKTLHDTGSVRTNKLTGTITKEINAIDIFTFNIYPDNSYYSDLKELTSLIKVYDKENLIFDGRVLTISPYMTDSGEIGKQVVCEGGLCFLKDSVPIIKQLKCTIRAYIATLLSAHNNSVESYKQIHIGNINCSQAQHTFNPGYEDTFSELTKNLISGEDIRGEMRVRIGKGGIRFFDFIANEFSEFSNKTIQLGRNMRSITQAIDPSEIITRLYPLGAVINDDTGERVTLSGATKYIDNDQLIKRYGVHAGTMVFDNITTPGVLSGAGRVCAGALKAAKVQYEVSAIDIDKKLDGFAVGCRYRVVNSYLGIDEVLRCIGTSIDINDRSQNVLTFGDKIDTISGMSARK